MTDDYHIDHLTKVECTEIITALAMRVPLVIKIAGQVAQQKQANGESDPLPSPIKKQPQKPAEKHE